MWNEVYEKCLCEELNVITELGFCDYLLIVADIVSFAKAEAKRICMYNCLPVGPGRGSAVGSLVCYLLGITDIDPVAHGLMFECFLNRSRKTMPDIDIDLAPFVRERVLQYLRDKYGANAVCGIIEPVRYKAKEAITLAAKFTTAQTGDKDYLAAGEALSKACKSGSRLTDNKSELSSFDSDDKAKRIIETACLCDGMVKTLSKHPCGIVIGNSPDISEYIPVICDNDRELLADCDKSYIESFYGLLKIDLLSLRTLDAVSNMLANIEKYAVLAYRMAWLFYHYPAYFLASSFRYYDDKDAVMLLYRECSRCEVEILPPDVNISGLDITAKGDTVRVGFSMIDGCKAVGKKIAADRRNNSVYESLSDFLLRIRPDEKSLKNLALSGALDCFKISRGSVVHNIDEIMRQTAELADLTRQIEKTDDTVTENSIKDKLDLCRKRITSLSEGTETIPLNMIVKAEQEIIGIPLSFSKLHECDSSGTARRTTCIKSMQIGKHRICGMIWECSERKRKKDKARFLSVLFSDGTGFIECVLPTHRYAKYEALFSEGNYLCLEGECSPDSKYENKNVFWIDAASKLEPINLSYYLRVSDYPEWLGAQKEIEKFTDYPMANLYISISDGDWTLYPRKVSPEIVKSFPMIEPGESR